MWSGSKVMMPLRMEGRQSNNVLEIEYIELAITWTLEVKKVESEMIVRW